VRLLWSSRSPFVRKVMIVVHELGAADRVQTERVVVNPADPNPAVLRVNPLGKIPALILADSTALYDSGVIVEYLNVAFGGALIPPSGEERWRVLTLQSLADGLMEADLRWLEERRLPETERRANMVAGMRAKIEACLDLLEDRVPDGVTIGSIATASALAHLDFRFADAPWRPRRPRLAAWFETFADRPSMRTTAFADQY